MSDLDRDHYDSYNLTVAQHPSETTSRMLARVLTFCHNATKSMQFTRGLSATDEPDLWQHDAHNNILLWIEVGEPDVLRIKKALHRAKSVRIYSFNQKSDTWWHTTQDKYNMLNAEVYQWPWSGIQQLAELVERNTQASVTISESTFFFATERGEAELPLRTLKAPAY